LPFFPIVFQLNISNNRLCGLDEDGRGTYTAEGITAIADALCVNGALTSLDLSSNQLCGLDRYGPGTYTAEGITAIADALRVNGALMIINVSWNNFGPEGAKVFADVLRVNGGLTSIDLSGNRVCGIWTDYSGQHGTYTAEGITAIAYTRSWVISREQCNVTYSQPKVSARHRPPTPLSAGTRALGGAV
jgi:hypothetical protein